MQSTVLVTGGAGYIGSHIVVELARSGRAAIVLDNFSTSAPDVLTRLRRITDQAIPCIAADVRDRATLARLFSEHSIDTVIHCAGLKAVGESEAQPLRYYDNNVGGALALVAEMAKAGVKSIVFSSSASVYGQPDSNPVGEDAPLRPASVYGRTKHMVELLLGDVAAADPAWRVVLLRYFNPAGAHSSGTIGEAPSAAPQNLVPILALAAAGRLERVDIYGDDWNTPDGTGVRDYIHVMDLAEGHVAAIDHLQGTTGVTTLNLGTGRGHSVLEVVASFERACGRVLSKRTVRRRQGDVAVYYADPTRANAVLGWRARRDLDTICADAWRWESGNRGG